MKIFTKIIMKVFSLIILSACSSILTQAQSLDTKVVLEGQLGDHDVFYDLLSDDDGSYYIIRLHYKSLKNIRYFRVERYNNLNEKIWERDIEGNYYFFNTPSGIIFHNFYHVNQKNKTNEFEAGKIDLLGNVTKPKVLLSVPLDYLNEFKVKYSYKTGRIFITHLTNLKKNKSTAFDILAVVFDSDLNKVYDDIIEIPHPYKKFKICSIINDGNTKLFINGGTFNLKFEANYHGSNPVKNHAIMSYDFKSKKLIERPVSFNVYHVSDIWISYQNNKLYLVGCHFPKLYGTSFSGLILYSFEPEKLESVAENIVWFDESKAEIPVGKKIGVEIQGSYGFAYTHSLLFNSKDEPIIIISNYMRKGTGFSKDDHIGIVQLTSSGRIAWKSGVNAPAMDHGRTIFTNYINNKLHLFYNEDKASENKVNLRPADFDRYAWITADLATATIDEKGEVAYDYVIKKTKTCGYQDYTYCFVKDKLYVPIKCKDGSYSVISYKLK